jgi:hypothetical protein
MTPATRMVGIYITAVVGAIASLVGTHVVAQSHAAAVADTVYQWPGEIAADAQTGNLRSDLGWRPGSQGESVLGVVRCGVATQTSPAFKRVMTAPHDSIVNPVWLWNDCKRAFHQWDSLEAITNGQWPAGVSSSSAVPALHDVLVADVAWRDGISVRQWRAMAGRQ